MAFHSKYICQQCGYSQVGWAGKCPECGEWNSLVETVVSTAASNLKSKRNNRISKFSNSKPIKLSDIKQAQTKRISTKIPELDRVLGGGLVAGQVVLIAGEPGIGKSTLLTQLASQLSAGASWNKSKSVKTNRSQQTNSKQVSTDSSRSQAVLYVCGEESASQVKVRADRLGIKKTSIELLEETDVDSIIDTIYSFQDPVLQAVIVDSIQTMTTGDLSGMAGSVGQVRECSNRLLHAAKSKNIPFFLVGHVTKEGSVAGPAVLAHIVDTVLWFEGDKTLTTRILRAVKNRFGSTDEVGIFDMRNEGLVSVENAEKIFLEKTKKQVPGSITTPIMQGSRPLLVEIQALVVPTKLAIPRRIAQGIDPRRLELLLAVLTRRCGLPIYGHDVFVNIAGGLKVVEPSTDLAICLAVASAYFDKPLSKNIIAVGEVGLLGEIREVVAEDKRLKTAKRLGYSLSVSSGQFQYINQAIKTLLR